MKKITMLTAVLVAGTIFANAETQTQVQVEVQGQKPIRENIMRRVIPTQRPTTATPPQPSGIKGVGAVGNTNGDKKDDNKGSDNGEVRGGGQPPIPMTGDSVTDAKIKALAIEMETKIKNIRDEYQVKIKEVIGTRKINNGPVPGPRMPIYTDDNRQNMGSTTDGAVPPMPRRNTGEVKGESVDGVGQSVGDGVGMRFKNFFRGFLGGN
ncbi:MAG: hypothetical protein NTW35_01140 [Candidatus Nomurabacteria bacterium]|nr:hypothetical protein [Candidatus Nomurabacteria bacterium]